MIKLLQITTNSAVSSGTLPKQVMSIKKITFLLLLLLNVCFSKAQQRVIIDNIRCWSTSGPTMGYWASADIKNKFASQLHTLLQKYQEAVWEDTTHLPIRLPVTKENFAESAPKPYLTDSAHTHMHLDISEVTPYEYFSKNQESIEDSLLIKRTRSVFQFYVILYTRDSILFSNTLDLFISEGNSPGIGIVSSLVSLTSTGFAEMLKKALTILLNPLENIAQAEIKAAPGFTGDNFILPKTAQKTRIYVNKEKGISNYTYAGSTEMIRSGQGQYEAIRLKGKNPDKPGILIEEAIRNIPDYTASEFVLLKQEGRDVIHNKNYTLKLLCRIDPESPPVSRTLLFTNFVKAPIHYLFSEKDTVAVFTITKNILSQEELLFPGTITNGYDSSSQFPLNSAMKATPVVYDYTINGFIFNQPFTIKCTGMVNTLKEIYLGNKLVCIAQGKFSPEKFVVFDTSLTPEQLNPLFLIGFNSFFE